MISNMIENISRDLPLVFSRQCLGVHIQCRTENWPLLEKLDPQKVSRHWCIPSSGGCTSGSCMEWPTRRAPISHWREGKQCISEYHRSRNNHWGVVYLIDFYQWNFYMVQCLVYRYQSFETTFKFYKPILNYKLNQ